MVWRSNIKILEAKVLPLVISALMHMVILYGLGAVNYNNRHNNGESVFTVELMFPDVGYNVGHRLPLREARKIFHAHKPDALSAHDKELFFAKPDNALTDSNGVVSKDYGDVALISSNPGDAKQSTGSRERSGKSTDGDFRKDIVESKFGSINGPSFLKMVKPEYPLLARRLGKEGRVILRLFIDEYGRLINVEITEKGGYGFDEAAVDAVRASIFRPALLNGLPVACKAVLPVKFKLE